MSFCLFSVSPPRSALASARSLSFRAGTTLVYSRRRRSLAGASAAGAPSQIDPPRASFLSNNLKQSSPRRPRPSRSRPAHVHAHRFNRRVHGDGARGRVDHHGRRAVVELPLLGRNRGAVARPQVAVTPKLRVVRGQHQAPVAAVLQPDAVIRVRVHGVEVEHKHAVAALDDHHLVLVALQRRVLVVPAQVLEPRRDVVHRGVERVQVLVP
mmetsp:Transcript_14546/g.61313  ORF Transcript_14546/g.61313 Transcript_14546/m.61313 type:complete len:211 (+) Transcript_14546:61-693(+)